MNNNKKKKITLIASILLATIIVILGTFAYWQVTKKQSYQNRIGSACISINITSENDDIDLTAMYPTSEQEMLNDTTYPPYTFTVTNNCDVPVNYTIALESIEDDGLAQTDYLNYNYVRVKLDNMSSAVYSSFDSLPDDTDPDLDYVIRNTKKIISKTLDANHSRKHKLKIWLDENTPIEETQNDQVIENINKYFFGKIKIIAGQNIVPDCYSVNNSGVLYAYDASCGKTAIIPDKVNNINVTTIGSNAFKADVPEFTYDDDRTIDDINENLAGQTCVTDGQDTEECKVDFSVVASPLLNRALNGDSSVMSQLTINDLWIVIYEDLSEAKEEALDNAILTALSDTGILGGMQMLGLDPDDIRIYDAKNEDIPSDSTIGKELYCAIENNNGSYSARDEIGYRVATGNTVKRVIIDTLDLTKATNLQRIENIAFSNLLDLNVQSNREITNAPEPARSLKKIIFDNKLNNVSIGVGAFAYSNLTSLTLTTTYNLTTESDYKYKYGTELSNLEDVEDYNDLALMGSSNPFYSSKIGTFTINAAGGVTVTGEKQFDEFGFIQNLVVGNGITGIGVDSFGFMAEGNNDCISDFDIANVSLPSTLTTIGNGGLKRYCGTTLTLPSGLTTIGNSAFISYSNNVTIPYSVTSVGNNAFSELDQGDTVTFKRAEGTLPFSTSYYVFGSLNNQPTFVYDPD